MGDRLGVGWRETVLPGGIALGGVVELALIRSGPWKTAAVFEVAACLLLVWRRQIPLVAGVGAPLIVFTVPWLGGRLNEASLPIAIVVLGSYTLGRHTASLRRGVLGVALVAAGILLTYAIADPRPHGWGDVLFLGALFLPPCVLGRVVARMAGQKALLLEQQALIGRQAATAERVRIARELHDALAHSISAMVVQAEVARDLIPTDPDGARASLDAVTAAGRTALAETGTLLHTLRDEPPASEPTPAATPEPTTEAPAPAPGLARLPELLEDVRARGLHVHVELAQRHTASSVVDVSAYRIVQEALTNALRHGDGTATLRLGESAGILTIHVANGVAGRSERGSGLGLTGMAERVALCGGRIQHGIIPDGRFEVAVSLPLAGGSIALGPPAIGAPA